MNTVGPGAGADRQLEQIVDVRHDELIGEMRVSSPMLTLPDGMMTLPVLTARITSSGDMPYDAQPVGIDADHDRALAAAERRRRRQAGERRELRAHAIERQILDLAEAARLAREHQVADRHRAGVEAHDERPDRAGRHERARAIDVADRLRHRLGHVGAGMERQLQQRRCSESTSTRRSRCR